MARYGNCKCRICTGPEMQRDDLDAPYAGAAIAVCPSCGQPKGRGYGCAVGTNRNWRWVATGGFTELCTATDCEATDASHYHRPQVLADADSGGFPASDDSRAMPRQEGALAGAS